MNKSKLQNICQKKQWQLPSYETLKQGPNHKPTFIATVKVNDLTFEIPNACPTLKQAEDKAAFLAVQHFWALDPSLCGSGRMYKNKLQRYAQIKKLSLPVYSCDTDGSSNARFKAKVIIDGKEFRSPSFFSRVKDAEQAAAKVALTSLLPHEEESDVFMVDEEESNQQLAPLPLETISEALNNMNIIESSD